MKCSFKHIMLVCLISFECIIISNTNAVNIRFNARIDLHEGSVYIMRNNGETLLNGVTFAVNSNSKTIVLDKNRCKFQSLKPIIFKDLTGKGQRIGFTAIDKNGTFKVNCFINLYDTIQAAVFECIYTNLSRKAVNVYSLEPIRIISRGKSGLQFSNANKCLLNGAMYYDPGMIHLLNETYQKPQPYGEAKGGIIADSLLAANNKTAQSWWNAALFTDYGKEALSIGYLGNQNSLGRISLQKENSRSFSLICESVYNYGHIVAPKQSISSDRVMINIGSDPYAALETYATVIGKQTGAKPGKAINGWCEWFYSLDKYSEDEILRNARVAAAYLKPYGMEYIQLDEGFQESHGDWQGNSRFPHGMKWLAQQIKSIGLKPAIWIAPFVISETTDIYRHHPEWLLRNSDGSLKRIGPWPNENCDWFNNESPKRYALDITNPEAKKWFTDLIDTIANQWGYDMIKVDFVAWTIFSADHFYDPTATPAQVYRKAMDIMHKTAGDKCHILDCGPGHISAGLINSMRIEYDQNYGYSDAVIKQYFEGASSSSGALGKRYFYHKNVWTNDIDHICLDMLSDSQAQAVATLIAMSGGNTLSGDRLLTLSSSKMDILKKCFPSSNEFVRPIDLLESDPQRAFVSTIKRNFEEWSVAAFFNADPMKSTTLKYCMERLKLNPYKEYVCFDFWKRKLAGVVTDSLEVHIQPNEVTLLSIHEKTGLPQVVSTDRHIMQGAVELSDVQYNKSTNVLTGTSIGPKGSKHSLFIYIPKHYDWSPLQGKLYDDYGNYALKKTESNILRVDVNFDQAEVVKWHIQFNKVDY